MVLARTLAAEVDPRERYGLGDEDSNPGSRDQNPVYWPVIRSPKDRDQSINRFAAVMAPRRLGCPLASLIA